MEAGFKSRKHITKGQDIDGIYIKWQLEVPGRLSAEISTARAFPPLPWVILIYLIHLDIVTAAVCHRQDFVTPHRVVQLA